MFVPITMGGCELKDLTWVDLNVMQEKIESVVGPPQTVPNPFEQREKRRRRLKQNRLGPHVSTVVTEETFNILRAHADKIGITMACAARIAIVEYLKRST